MAVIENQRSIFVAGDRADRREINSPLDQPGRHGVARVVERQAAVFEASINDTAGLTGDLHHPVKLRPGIAALIENEWAVAGDTPARVDDQLHRRRDDQVADRIGFRANDAHLVAS